MCCFSEKYILFAGRFVAGLSPFFSFLSFIKLSFSLKGFGVGLESVVVPVLLSEIATADTRGTITTLHQVIRNNKDFFFSFSFFFIASNYLWYLYSWYCWLWLC